MMFLCVGCQNGVNAYILPSAECDLRLSSEEKGLLNVAFLVGGVISSVFWGVIADAYGRKNILVGTLLVDGLLTLFASCAQNFQALLIFRAISGFTIGAPGSLVYTYLGEFHAAKHRVKSICYVGFFWTLSWLILPGLAWMIIPLRIKWQYEGFLYNSWRLYFAVIGLPTLVVAFVLMKYPESPKFLLSRGKSNEALDILRYIYASNAQRDQSVYPVKYLCALNESKGQEKKSKDIDVKKNRFGDSCSDRHRVGGFENNGNKPSLLLELLRNVYQQIRALGSPPYFKWALLCWTIYFMNMFGYYGLGLWFPELFNRFESYYKIHPNASVSVCELVTRLNENADIWDNSSISETLDCDRISIDQRVFINTLTINGVCLLGNVASGYLADRVGRRTIPVTTMLVSGLAGFAIYFVKSSFQNLIVACVYSLAITTANFVIGGVVVDIFPTHIGAVAICMMTFFGRVGAIASNLAFGMLLDISCEVPIFLVGGIVLLGGLLALLLPPAKR
ncbi:synaptic vesicle glycoprotein 2C-like isoform X2 [Venturia canescens]|nr:synaptic vesicle glycoprotein 2C-like isoform X2 [Venturia canescens]XP_043286888.1 synaptic vesicle glycoprotein 2C-like isoform X2 [Venturia canescens]